MSTDPPFHLQEDGNTALDLAVGWGHEEMARVIRGGGGGGGGSGHEEVARVIRGGGGCFSRVGGVLEVAHALLHAPYTWMHVEG